MYNNNPFPNIDGFDPYFLLGLTQENPTVDDIKQAYQKAALNSEPDNNLDVEAKRHVKRALAAYELLMHANTRAEYDQWKKLFNELKTHSISQLNQSLTSIRVDMLNFIIKAYKIDEAELHLLTQNPVNYLSLFSIIHFPEQNAEELKKEIAQFRLKFSMFYQVRDLAPLIRMQYDEIQAISEQWQRLIEHQQRKIIETSVAQKPFDPNATELNTLDDDQAQINNELHQQVDLRLKTLKDGFVNTACDYIDLNRKNRSRFWFLNWHGEQGVKRAESFISDVNEADNEQEVNKVLLKRQEAKDHWFFSWPTEQSLKTMIAEKQKQLMLGKN